MDSAEKDPDGWIADLSRLRQRLKDMISPLSNQDFIIHTLNNVPKACDTVVEQLEDYLQFSDEILTGMSQRQATTQVSMLREEWHWRRRCRDCHESQGRRLKPFSQEDSWRLPGLW